MLPKFDISLSICYYIMNIENPVEQFKALSDSNRIKIVGILVKGETCACKLLEELNVSQPTLSHHMGILQRSGLVNGVKKGQWVYYSISLEKFEGLKNYLENIIGKTLSDSRTCDCE